MTEQEIDAIIAEVQGAEDIMVAPLLEEATQDISVDELSICWFASNKPLF